jgi:hypothetical protein
MEQRNEKIPLWSRSCYGSKRDEENPLTEQVPLWSKGMKRSPDGVDPDMDRRDDEIPHGPHPVMERRGNEEIPLWSRGRGLECQWSIIDVSVSIQDLGEGCVMELQGCHFVVLRDKGAEGRNVGDGAMT